MTSYKVGSKAIIDLVNEIKSGRLVLSPYFQRDLVWRKMHKQDFVTTIIMGFPFPQIFISRGSLDVERMVSTSLIVDGQQRMSTIREFVDNKLDVNGRLFKQFSTQEKEEFLKYEVPIIDLDLPGDDPRIKEIFKRLNRTFYSLTEIEKLSSEYSASDFMLLAKLLTNQISEPKDASDAPSDDTDDYVEDQNEVLAYSKYDFDPNIPQSFWDWSKEQDVFAVQELILNRSIFSAYELSRQVHLIFTLNILSTIVGESYFSRNSKTRDYLEEYRESVPHKDRIVIDLENVANFILDMKIPEGSYWKNKANIFTIIIVLYTHIDFMMIVDPINSMERLMAFEVELPFNYEISAKEAVNRKRERTLRHNALSKVLFEEVIEIRSEQA